MGFNTLVHETTGYTPFELTFGRLTNPPTTIANTASLDQNELFKLWKAKHDYQAKARVITGKAKLKNKATQDSRVIRTQTILKIGDQVLIHNDHKT